MEEAQTKKAEPREAVNQWRKKHPSSTTAAMALTRLRNGSTPATSTSNNDKPQRDLSILGIYLYVSKLSFPYPPSMALMASFAASGHVSSSFDTIFVATYRLDPASSYLAE